ncbi:hypothetical protein E0H86_11795 [Acinetobacter sp. ANC 4635]|uniref:hypothetical protein n=1 Tax=Acinetobacter sp. ANC 4635 TaxID=2529846 RepID=UPI00103CDD0B|nr:hypothetical protein [Acinetobacter sp. ANC 4635]TCB28482.1 hypothetical protein E0H86_11795 [Acinetobacter sp. ANC 4635]
MSNIIFVPKLKHQKILESVLQVDRKQKNEDFKLALETAKNYFEKYRWWKVANGKAIFDSTTGILWEKPNTVKTGDHIEACEYVKKKNSESSLTWKLPNIENIKNVVEDSTFPLLNGPDSKYILQQTAIQLNITAMWLDRDYPSTFEGSALILAISSSFQDKDISEILLIFEKIGWKLLPYSVSESDRNYQIFLANLEVIHWYITIYKTSEPNIELPCIWENIDYISTRLPRLDHLRFTDIDQGMWEFYIPTKDLQNQYLQIETEESIRPRNPELDIRNAKIAIDFGTSSTVVAIRSNGKDELLRIGLQENDFKKNTISDNDFENPTILEFLNIQEVLNAWESEVYRPLVDWDTVHCSHEARTRFRENDSDPKIVSSIFARLKQWALRNNDLARVKITDQKHHEYEFKPLFELNPTKGQSLNILKDYPQLDPIELYAWFLGMNINWRDRGIFLKYYMTFPVAYPNEVKEKILASFRRGLLRSFPESLIYSERFNEFSVQELASEPAAFAASALNTLKIEATENGTPYAVFDFGGGTTDFDYGIYRLATLEEENEGADDVIEHFGSAGDQYLGGENLLENMAYQVFKHNQNTCRDKEISFTKPIDADSFVGSERLIAQTQAAYTNTTLLMSKLRPLWEGGKFNQNDSGILPLTLLNRHGQRTECDIQIPQQELIEWLISRIRKGLVGFFTALKTSFEGHLKYLPDEVHILLAGNSSRSRIVLGLLGCLEDDESQILKELFQQDLAEIFWDNIPAFEVHLPLQADDEMPFKPTTKTGVALGLLRVSPGETLKVINHAQENNADSPFQFFVGTHRRGMFTASIKRGDSYEKWQELGAIRAGVFPLLYTTQSQALNGIERGTNGLKEHDIQFSGSDIKGKKVFGRIITPDSIEIGLAETADQLEQLSHRQMIQLK